MFKSRLLRSELSSNFGEGDIILAYFINFITLSMFWCTRGSLLIVEFIPLFGVNSNPLTLDFLELRAVDAMSLDLVLDELLNLFFNEHTFQLQVRT